MGKCVNHPNREINNAQFMNEFTSALFLPHTDMEDFPSVKEKLL